MPHIASGSWLRESGLRAQSLNLATTMASADGASTTVAAATATANNKLVYTFTVPSSAPGEPLGENIYKFYVNASNTSSTATGQSTTAGFLLSYEHYKTPGTKRYIYGHTPHTITATDQMWRERFIVNPSPGTSVELRLYRYGLGTGLNTFVMTSNISVEGV